MSRTGDLLDAVATELNAVVWGEPVTIGKAYLPEIDRTELATLHVAVVVQSMALETLSRSARRWVYKVDVGICKNGLTPRTWPRSTGCSGCWKPSANNSSGRSSRRCRARSAPRCENEPPYSPEHLAQKRVFTGVVTLTISVAV